MNVFRKSVKSVGILFKRMDGDIGGSGRFKENGFKRLATCLRVIWRLYSVAA